MQSTVCRKKDYTLKSSASADRSNLNDLTPQWNFYSCIHGRESQTRQKSLLAWSTIFCSLNKWNNTAKKREVDEGE